MGYRNMTTWMMRNMLQRGGFAAAIAILMLAIASIPKLAAQTSAGLSSACGPLTGRNIPSAAIGLPSGPANLTSATFVPAKAAAGPNAATPDHCQVLGTIASVDPAAQLIHFQLNLPITWNGKAVQYGGGGFNGTLVTGLAPLRDAAPGDPLPLTRGYVTVGTDSGHQASSFAANRIGEFGVNDEMLRNYGSASYKKVRARR